MFGSRSLASLASDPVSPSDASSFPATAPCARYKPAAKRSGTAAELDSAASNSARSARRWKALSTSLLEALRLFTRHFAIPPGMMEARPLLADCAARHRRERPRFRSGAEIDVADDR